MNKFTLVLLLILTLNSCQNRLEPIHLEDELRGYTFNLIFTGEKDTLTIEFKDKTYTIFEHDHGNLPWRISSVDHHHFLVLDRRVMAIKQKDNNRIKGLLIGEKDYEITLEKRNVNWDKALLEGRWIEEKNLKFLQSDSLQMPPLPPPPPGVLEDDFQYPPCYEIHGNTIATTYFYEVFKSKIDISNTNEFIKMTLRTTYDKVDELWKIKSLNDSIMIIDRTLKKEVNIIEFLTVTETNVKLIRIPN